MRSEIVESSGERPTVNEAVGVSSVFLAGRISHSICASQVSSYVLRPVHIKKLIMFNYFFQVKNSLSDFRWFSICSTLMCPKF
jgi:hypothetical protein